MDIDELHMRTENGAHIPWGDGVVLSHGSFMPGPSLRARITKMPHDLSALPRIAELDLSGTSITDLAPLKGLDPVLLDISNTQISDLSPMASWTVLVLYLAGSQVRDLRPILNLEGGLGSERFDDDMHITFHDTPACDDPAIAAAAAISDNNRSRFALLAHLRTLPPWPEPLSAKHPSEPSRTSADQDTFQVSFIQRQVAIVLRNAGLSRDSAKGTAELIRFALRDAPIVPGTNRMPEVLETLETLAEVLDRVGDTIASDEAVESLTERFAELEKTVARLTAELADAKSAKEAADALIDANGFWANYKQHLGKPAANATVAASMALMALGIPTSMHYFLGAGHPAVVSLFKVLQRQP